MSMDSKLDMILARLDTLNEKFDKLDTKVNVLQTASASHDLAIADLQKEVLQLKEAGNHRDQASRANVIRIFNLPVSEDESSNSNKIWPLRSMTASSSRSSWQPRLKVTSLRYLSSRPSSRTALAFEALVPAPAHLLR